MKVRVIGGYHRYELTGETKMVPKHGGGTEEVPVERKITHPKGKNYDVPSEDMSEEAALDGLAKGLLEEVE